MRLRLESPGAAPYWLVGDPTLNERTETSRALDDTLQITRMQQAVSGAGQDVKDFWDRGNQSVQIEATAHRVFPDVFARMDFLSRLAPIDQAALEHRWEGVVWLREDAAGSYREWQLPGAVISLSGVTLEGETGLRLRYRVQAPGFGATTGAAQKLLLLRHNAEPALVAITAAELQAAAESVSLTEGDWIDIILVWRDGVTVSVRIPIDAMYGITLPITDGTLSIIEAYANVWLGLEGKSGGSVEVVDVIDPDPDYLQITTEGDAGAGCEVALVLGRGSADLWALTDSGTEERLPINTLPTNKNLIVNTNA